MSSEAETVDVDAVAESSEGAEESASDEAPARSSEPQASEIVSEDGEED